MFSHHRARPAILSTVAVLMLLVALAGGPGAGLNQPAGAAPAAASPASAIPPDCGLLTPFDASKFPISPNINNSGLPLAPGMKLVLDGRINAGGQPLNHQVVLIVTDLTKVIAGVRAVVLWDRDFNQGVLTESELAFHAQDAAG